LQAPGIDWQKEFKERMAGTLPEAPKN